LLILEVVQVLDDEIGDEIEASSFLGKSSNSSLLTKLFQLAATAASTAASSTTAAAAAEYKQRS